MAQLVETVGSKGVVKRTEFVRIITRALHSLGYEEIGTLLENQSGIPLQSQEISSFKNQVLAGNWDQSVETLHAISLLDKSTLTSQASFLIWEQQFLEFLRDDHILDSLNTLRKKIAPLDINSNRVQELASCTISPPEDLNIESRPEILEKLHNFLPPSLMIHPTRLESIIEEAISLRRLSCLYHNISDRNVSLYSDHKCGMSRLPCQAKQILHMHVDEVWFLQFSHNGKYLASASKDKSAIIWEVTDGGEVRFGHILGHEKPVLTVSWSPDDDQLLTCGEGEVIKRWEANSGRLLHVYERTDFGFISCAWCPVGFILAGTTDQSIILLDLEGAELDSWKDYALRMSEMAITNDGTRILSIYEDSSIAVIDREKKKILRLLPQEGVITSFSLSNDNKVLLVNLLNRGIHFWSLLKGYEGLISRYEGRISTRFIIRSCLGGLEETFIASGSEDSRVFIWHRGQRIPIMQLQSIHTGTVNCVSWNPTNIHMLASASDDHKIVIWGPPS
ncbi:hypothetical protein Peur_016817 [Populus x canadensis]